MIPTVQMSKLSHNEVRGAQVCTARKYWIWDLNPGHSGFTGSHPVPYMRQCDYGALWEADADMVYEAVTSVKE